jgi:hypothetical protein
MWVSPGSFSIGCKKELEVILDTKTNVSHPNILHLLREIPCISIYYVKGFLKRAITPSKMIQSNCHTDM